MAALSTILNKIRTAILGLEIRSNIADGIEAINNEVEATTERQNDLDATFQNLIIDAGNSNAEIVDARYDSVNNENHATLKERMDSQSASLADIAINVKKFGVKGDGVTDDTIAIQNIFDNNTKKTIYFPDGVYLITSTLNMNTDNSILLSKHAEIKANAIMDYMIEWNSVLRTGTYNMSFKEFIKGGTFNANYLATNIMILSYFMGMTLDDVKFLNFSGEGLNTRENSPSNELIATNLYFRNDTAVVNSLAINNNGRDNEFSNIIIRDIHHGILSYDSRFSHIHGWIGLSDLLVGSYFIKALDAYVQLNQCYADTYQYPFISCFGTLIINNSMALWNKDIYTQAIQTSNPICTFYSDANEATPTTYGTFICTNNAVHCSLTNTLLTNRYLSGNVFANNYIRGTGSGTIDYTNFKYKSNMVQGGYGASVNDLTEVGAYSITAGATNLPEGAYAYGQLIVNMSSTFAQLDTYQYKTQIYIPSNNSSKVYIRYWITTGWSNWIVLAGNVHGLATDCNTALTSGAYSITDATANKPNGSYSWGQLIVNISATSEGKDNISFGTQIYIPSTSGGKFYFRYYASSAWSAWYLLTGTIVS